MPLILTISPGTLVADYEAGVAAYQKNDYRAAMHELLPLAQEGDAPAQALVGMMHRYGEGVKLDETAAFHWYLASAKQGYGPAQISVAEMLAQGQGTAADPAAALVWARKAEQQGIARAAALVERLSEDRLAPEPAARPAPSRQWNFDLPAGETTGDTGPPGGPAIPATPSAEPRAHGAWRVQLGAMRSRTAANRFWESVRAKRPDLLQHLRPIYPENEGTGGLIVRIQVGHFDTLAEAKQFCQVLTSQALTTGCLPIRPQPAAAGR